MKIEGELGETSNDGEDLSVLTRLIARCSELADCAMALYGTEEAAQGMKVMEIADKLTDDIGVLAAQSGYTQNR